MNQRLLHFERLSIFNDTTNEHFITNSHCNQRSSSILQANTSSPLSTQWTQTGQDVQRHDRTLQMYCKNFWVRHFASFQRHNRWLHSLRVKASFMQYVQEAQKHATFVHVSSKQDCRRPSHGKLKQTLRAQKALQCNTELRVRHVTLNCVTTVCEILFRVDSSRSQRF